MRRFSFFRPKEPEKVEKPVEPVISTDDPQMAEFASQIAENPAFRAIIAKMRNDAVRDFTASEASFGGDAQRREAHTLLSVITRVELTLAALASSHRVTVRNLRADN